MFNEAELSISQFRRIEWVEELTCLKESMKNSNVVRTIMSTDRRMRSQFLQHISALTSNAVKSREINAECLVQSTAQ